MTKLEKHRSVRTRQWRRYLVTSAATAFVTNWIWEMTQMRAYRELDVQPWWETAARCTGASFADVFLTLLCYGVGAAASRDVHWAWAGRAKIYCALAVLGFATAVIGERIGLAQGEWSYNERMPIVPGLGVGAWPVLQLTLLIPLSFAAGNAARRRAEVG